MGFLEQLKALTQLPGVLKQKNASQAQAQALQQRLQQAQKPIPLNPITTAPTISSGFAATTTPVAPVTTPRPQTPTAPFIATPAVVPQRTARTAGPAATPTSTYNTPTYNPQVQNLQQNTTQGSQPIAPTLRPTDEQARASQGTLEETQARQNAQNQSYFDNPQIAAILKSFEVSQAEQDAERRLNELNYATELGLRGTEEQTIPLEFITGQKEAIERRKSTLAMPLQAQLASEQSKRQAAFDVGKVKLDLLGKEQEAGKPIEVGGSLIDPRTGKVLYQAPKEEKRSSAYQEYLDAQKEGYAGTFSQYQTEDANRKARIAATGMTPYQTNQSFLTISNKYQADQIVNQAVNGKTAALIADQVIANPEKATSQLASLYLLVKNLDPTSAVREGELSLANQTQSYLQRFSNSLTRIGEGRVISPEAAKELALATKELVKAWNDTATFRQKQYISQANAAGVGSQFNDYLGGYQSNFVNQQSDPLGIR